MMILEMLIINRLTDNENFNQLIPSVKQKIEVCCIKGERKLKESCYTAEVATNDDDEVLPEAGLSSEALSLRSWDVGAT